MPNSTATTHKSNTAQNVTGIVLAGGAGQRMGGEDKGWIEYQHKPMIEHVLARFKPQVHHLIISCNRNIERYQQLGHQIVRDAQADYQGPLAGIYAALQLVETDWAAVVPVDAPMLATNLVSDLLECALQHDAAACCAINAGEVEPTFCVINKSALPALQQYLVIDGNRSVQGFLKSVNCAYRQFHDAFGFRNLNRPEDLR